MFERPKSGEKTLLVHIEFSHFTEHADLQELHLLTESSGAQIVGEVTGKRVRPDTKLFIGKGKAEEITALKSAVQADLIIFNHSLTPAQERNLEKQFECRVLDRSGLILDIFAQRAKSHEGKLQVELAQLQYMSTRLVRGWTHLERQKGGIGLRGPGETQLETDRRLIRGRITMILKRLEKVCHQRELGRRKRKKQAMPTISLVGYTNAGKSTLFNSLTAAGVYVEDQLFATLDPTLRQLQIPYFGKTILVDTVGFIRHLPHDLVESFRATLEETAEADLLLHVVDVSSDERDELIHQVDAVLHDVKADHQPVLMVYNKIDQLENVIPRIDYDKEQKPKTVWMCAQKGQGIDLLKQAISEMLSESFVKTQLKIPATHSKFRAALHQHNAILKASYDDEGNMFADVAISQEALQSICRRCDVIDWQQLESDEKSD